jgi:cytochrome P450
MLKEHTKEPEIELGVWFTRATLDIIGVAGFGRDFSSLKNPDEPFVRDYQALMEPKQEKAMFFLLSMYIPYRYVSRIPFWSVPRDLRRISAFLFSWGRDMAQERRAELADPKVPQSEKQKRKDILSLLVKSNDFTDAELSHQSLTMLAAGHETTSSSLSWCMVLLAKNPRIQQELREEIRAYLPSPSNSSGTTSSIDALPVLNAVCCETLRFQPVVHITSRRVARPTRLGNYMLPVDTNIYIVPWAFNRSKLFWGPDAGEFNPYRWINVDEKGNKIVNNHGGVSSTYGFETFLHGPRSCIGSAFARSELKHLLAAMIGRFEVKLTRPEDKYRPVGMVTSKPLVGTWMKLNQVEGW